MTSFRNIRSALVWCVFFVVSLGLGYPSLQRYDPRLVGGLSDAEAYYQTVVGGPQPPAGDLAHRLLVPHVAKPFYWLAKGRVGSWNAGFAGLLLSNALFTATTAALLVSVGSEAVGSYAAAVLGSTLYLLSFAVANLNLSGLVDSGEACLLMALVWTLSTNRWLLLPAWAVPGALAKETFVPLSIAFAVSWWLTLGARDQHRTYHAVCIGTMAATGMATVVVAMTSVSRFTPWSFARAMWVESGSASFYVGPLLGCVLDRTFWYVFGWLLPLGVWRLGQLPKPWVRGVAWASVAALAMGAYNDAGGNTARAVFNVAGPILSLSAAVLLTSMHRPSDHGE